jgi:hypothetical protein
VEPDRLGSDSHDYLIGLEYLAKVLMLRYPLFYEQQSPTAYERWAFT